MTAFALPALPDLAPDGAPFETASSWLQPVRWRGLAAMCKRPKPGSDEAAGGAFLAHWRGRGAVRLYARSGEAVVMERAEGTASLRAMALDERDDEAAAILASAVRTLHATAGPIPGEAEALEDRFQNLFEFRSILYISPRCSHTYSRRAPGSCLKCLIFYLCNSHQVITFNICMIPCCLRTISTIFRTASGFNRN